MNPSLISKFKSTSHNSCSNSNPSKSSLIWTTNYHDQRNAGLVESIESTASSSPSTPSISTAQIASSIRRAPPGIGPSKSTPTQPPQPRHPPPGFKPKDPPVSLMAQEFRYVLVVPI